MSSSIPGECWVFHCIRWTKLARCDCCQQPQAISMLRAKNHRRGRKRSHPVALHYPMYPRDYLSSASRTCSSLALQAKWTSGHFQGGRQGESYLLDPPGWRRPGSHMSASSAGTLSLKKPRWHRCIQALLFQVGQGHLRNSDRMFVRSTSASEQLSPIVHRAKAADRMRKRSSHHRTSHTCKCQRIPGAPAVSGRSCKVRDSFGDLAILRIQLELRFR